MSLLDSPRGPGRREFIAFGLGAFVVASVPLAARRRGQLVRRSVPLMGTIAELAVVSDDPRHAHAALDAAVAELLGVAHMMTRFTSSSDIGRANAGAAREGVPVSPRTARVVAEALRWAESTDGAYDPAIGGAVALWDVANRHAPPSEDAVRRLARRGLYRAVDVGTLRGAPALRYHDADVRIDLGAIAKGYGVDRAVDALRAWGIRHALVNVGGDLYALGNSPEGEAWRVGIQDPTDERSVMATVQVSDAAVATSGTYRQFFRHRGIRFHHLLDPMTAKPRVTGTQSLTVQADCCMHADVAATALYGIPAADAARILARRGSGGAVVHSA